MVAHQIMASTKLKKQKSDAKAQNAIHAVCTLFVPVDTFHRPLGSTLLSRYCSVREQGNVLSWHCPQSSFVP